MIPDDALCAPRALREGNDPADPYQVYWTENGLVFCTEGGGIPLRGADPVSFRYFAGGFGHDRRGAWFMGSRLRDADGSRFRALNYTWFTDGAGVWCVGGRVKEADGTRFDACDAGVDWINGAPIPRSYGKDGERVFFYDFNGKANWVRKADPASFESLEGARFGRDANHVFSGHATIARAERASWRMLGGHYSRDARRIYYFNRVIEGADLESFRVVPSRYDDFQFARDIHRRYWNDESREGQTFDEDLWRRHALEPA